MRRILWITLFFLYCGEGKSTGTQNIPVPIPFTGIELQSISTWPKRLTKPLSFQSKAEAQICHQDFCFESPWSFARTFWGFSPNDVWAVGDAGTVLHFDGTAWKQISIDTYLDLLLLWGSNPQDVWIVAKDGSLFWFDGKSWSTKGKLNFDGFTGIKDGYPEKIWGFSQNDIWVFGHKRQSGEEVLYHYNGLSWEESTKGWSFSLKDIWVSDEKNAWLVSCDDAIGTQMSHYDGKKWNVELSLFISTKQRPCLKTISGSGPLDIWAMGYDQKEKRALIYHYDGTWKDQSSLFPKLSKVYPIQCKAYGKDDYWLGGTNNDPWTNGLWHYDGTSWEQKLETNKDLRFGGAQGDDFWVSQGGDLLRYQTNSFQSWAQDITFSQETIDGMWGASQNNLWLVMSDHSSESPQSTLISYNGISWTHEYSVKNQIHSIFGLSYKDIWMGGENSYLAHFDGSIWSKAYGMSPYSSAKHFGAILNIWGSASDRMWAVGENGMILYFNGQTWNQVQLPFETEETFTSVFGLTKDDVWIVGQKGLIIHYDGISFQKLHVDSLEMGDTISLSKGFAIAPNDIWFVGKQAEKPLFLHYDGAQFVKSFVPETDSSNIVGIWGNDSQEVWAVGSKGTVYTFVGGSWQFVTHRIFSNPDILSIWGLGKDHLFIFGAKGTLLHKIR